MKVKNFEGIEIDIINAYVWAWRAKGLSEIKYIVRGVPLYNLGLASPVLKRFSIVEEALDYVDAIQQQIDQHFYEQENCSDE